MQAAAETTKMRSVQTNWGVSLDKHRFGGPLKDRYSKRTDRRRHTWFGPGCNRCNRRTSYDSGLHITITPMNFPETERTTLKRLPARSLRPRFGYGILDEGFSATCSFVVEGQPFVMRLATRVVDDRSTFMALRSSVCCGRCQKASTFVSVSLWLMDWYCALRFPSFCNYRSV